MEVIWSPAALSEVERIYDYLSYFNPQAARQVVVEIIAAGDGLKTFPDRGRPIGNNRTRELVLTYPYIIRYRITRGTVRILRVRHTARRPTSAA